MNSDAATIPGRPADWSDRSYYLAMRDGVRLAVSLYFPGRVVPRAPAPVLLIQTRYGRAGARKANHPRSIGPWLDAGFVAAVVDVRGSTASFGARTAELGLSELMKISNGFGMARSKYMPSTRMLPASTGLKPRTSREV